MDTDPDCTRNTKICAPPKMVFNITSRDQIIIHEDYDPLSKTQTNDIALIRLNKPVLLYNEDPKMSLVSPICLPWNEKDPGRNLKQNTTVLVSGWGKIKTSLSDIKRKKKFGVNTRFLMYVTLPIANEFCSQSEALKEYWDPKTKLCAGGKQGTFNV